MQYNNIQNITITRENIENDTNQKKKCQRVEYI